MLPKAHGLYRPEHEHDACGIGAVVHISGKADHAIVEQARQVLVHLHHRGAAGADETTGDGAGILLQVPHRFFAESCGLPFGLPPAGRYGVGTVFAPTDAALRDQCETALESAAAHYGLVALGWRDVPADRSCLGKIALMGEPVVRQFFVGAGDFEGEELERKLFLVRKRAERLVREGLGPRGSDFYICSLSARTLVYKGMFMAAQLFAYYGDLACPTMETALAIVHQRYSTNTFPNWRLAQPFRMVAHNGEINTLAGNANRIRAREGTMKSSLLGEGNPDLLPVLLPGGSDSAQFDNVVELLVRAGRSLPHSMMMMIPEAFGQRYHISTDKRSFYEYHSTIMEPWDGPAAMIFTDGRLVGGTLDRNGLRPCRYVVTDDDLVVMASEAGVIDFPPERIRTKGRLQPGRMFLVDTAEGRIIADNEIKSKIARQKPYRRWVEQNRIELLGLFSGSRAAASDNQSLMRQLRAFGYTREDLSLVLLEMATNAQEPVGSMGNDTPLAVLSDGPKSLFGYFKQLFAQVTNPPIDPLREGLVMSLMSYTGKEYNLLDETPEHARQLKLPHPILTCDDIERLRSVNREDFRVATLDATFETGAAEGDLAAAGRALQRGLDELLYAAGKAIAGGAGLLIVSDRQISPTRAPIPALLATAALHHGLLARRLRGATGIIVESGEPREIMHFCLLCGYGATAINPYLALETLAELRRRGDIPRTMEMEEVIDRYISAVKKGILKTISKMGISTLRSYRGAQLFEAIGLGREVIDAYFTGTSSRIGGVGLEQIAADALARHRDAYAPRRPGELELDFGGEYSYRDDGERHLWNPTTIASLQHAVRQNDPRAYEQYARAVNEQTRTLCTLRGLFEFTPGSAVPLEEVEPADEIVKRFCTGAMSHGSISKEAHETMAAAMNGIGAMSNTGEGGEDPKRYKRSSSVAQPPSAVSSSSSSSSVAQPPSAVSSSSSVAQQQQENSKTQPRAAVPQQQTDSLNSGIKQVASARFGVTIEYLANAREIQIKMAQGAKPGEGGQLPGNKVTDEIARLRHATPGVTLISPPPHHDIYSIEDLAQLIYDLKCASPGAKVSVKLVAQVGVGTVAAGVAKAGADEILISGHDGGTGASPLSSIKHTGGPWELGLAEAQQVLVLNNLRDRVRLQADGQIKTGRDVVIAALMGAERFGFGTAALVSMGCVLMRKCHKGTCPVGIASQDPELRKRFPGKAEHLQRFMFFVAEEVRRIMSELGFRRFEEMIGCVERLSMRQAVEHYKARGLDFTAVLCPPNRCDGHGVRQSRPQRSSTDDNLDWQVLERVRPAIERKEKVALELPIRNLNRTVGAVLSNRVTLARGAEGLPDGTIELTFRGSAGQSFGAFLAPGITLRLVGESNDYLGKGLSGGRIVVLPPAGAAFEAAENVIVGNTLLYGATRGEAFICGLAGERFAVRNSGATAVVEGVGDHGCEYMTGGTVVVLGQTGRNFAAGMSGGIAYVLDEHQLFDTLCNLDMVDLESVYLAEDKALLRDLIERHARWTHSGQARRILDNWPEMVGRFVKVMPIDYRKALERLSEREQRGADFSPATEEVFGG